MQDRKSYPFAWLFKNLNEKANRRREQRCRVSNLYRRLSARTDPFDLSDQDFYLNIDLTLPGLEKTAQAVEEQNYHLANQALLDYLRERESPRFFYHSRDRREMVRLLEPSRSSRSRTLDIAAHACAHQFNLLGTGWSDLGKSIDWFSDFAGHTWIWGHYRHLNDILYKDDFQNPHYIGDIKIPWEFNKHIHFVELGKAYWLTGDETYVRELLAQWQDWIGKNPVNWGVNWTQNLIVAQRTISWLLALFLILDSPALHPDIFAQILKNLLWHGAYMPEHFEFADRGSNHLFGNISGLFMLAFTFPEFRDSAAWETRCLEILSRELAAQVYDDGVQYEQSIPYHRFVLEFVLIFAVLLHRNGRRLPPADAYKLEQMLELVMHMTGPDGRIQPISDADGARVFNFNGAHINDYRSYLALGAVLFKRPDFKYVADRQVEEVIWLMGIDAFRELEAMKAEAPRSLNRAFTGGGYFIMRDSWERGAAWAFFDCGQVGMGDLPPDLEMGTHGHSDMLHFGLAAYGEHFLTDIGSYTYTASKPWHDYFRSSRGHNLLLVDGEDQGILTTTWAMKGRARPQAVRWTEADGYVRVSGGHDGYRRLAQPVMQSRELLFLPKRKWMLVRDLLQGEGEHDVELYFHLMPDKEVSLRGDGGTLIKGRNGTLKLQPYFPAPFRGRVVRGKSGPIDGWYAEDYGTKEPASVLIYRARVRLPAEVLTWIAWDLGLFDPPQKAWLDRMLEEHPHRAPLATGESRKAAQRH